MSRVTLSVEDERDLSQACEAVSDGRMSNKQAAQWLREQKAARSGSAKPPTTGRVAAAAPGDGHPRFVPPPVRKPASTLQRRGEVKGYRLAEKLGVTHQELLRNVSNRTYDIPCHFESDGMSMSFNQADADALVEQQR